MIKAKWLGLILAAAMILSVFSGCTPAPVTWTETVQVAALKGPTALGMLNMMEEYQDNAENPYKFTIAAEPNDVVAMINKGEVDIAAIPTNLASTLYHKKGEIKMLALNTLGVLYVVENGNEIQSVSDLEGKTIYSTGQGAVPEYALNYVLEKNNLTDKVTVEYKGQHAELTTLMAAGKASVAVLPQPFVTAAQAKNPGIRVAIDLTQEWEAANNATLTMGCVVVRNEFLLEHEDIVKSFMAAYEASAIKANEDVDGTAKLAGRYDIVAQAVAQKAIPACNIVYIDGAEMKTKANTFFAALAGMNPASIGGKLPDDGLYYIAK